MVELIPTPIKTMVFWGGYGIVVKTLLEVLALHRMAQAAACYVGIPFWRASSSLAAPLAMQLLVKVTGKVEDDGPSTQAPATYVGNKDEVLGSGRQQLMF